MRGRTACNRLPLQEKSLAWDVKTNMEGREDVLRISCFLIDDFLGLEHLLHFLHHVQLKSSSRTTIFFVFVLVSYPLSQILVSFNADVRVSIESGVLS